MKMLVFFLFAISLYASDRLVVSVSIAPLEFFVKQITGDLAQVHVIVPKNKNAEIYEPDFTAIQNISSSSIIIGIGMPFEKVWLPRIIKSNNVKAEILLLQDYLLDSKHDHEAHLWLSINNARKITQILSQHFASLDTEHGDIYKGNAEKLIAQLDLLKSKIESILQSMPNKTFIIYHPIFSQFDKEYGLIEKSLEKHGKTYGLQDITNLSELGKSLGIKRIFSQYDNRDMRTLSKSMNAALIIIDPLSQDYISNLEHILTEISQSYKEL